MKLYTIYESDIPAVSSAVILRASIDGPQVLLVKRKRPPCAGEWDIPGGHLNNNEDPLTAVIREIHEETGLVCRPQFVQTGKPIKGRCYDQYIYASIVPDKTMITAGSDASRYEWVNINKLPKVAFGQDTIIKDIAKTLLGENIIYDRRSLLKEDTDKGTLIVFEGVDGAGKSTQTENLCKKLRKENVDFISTCWNSSKPIHPAIKKLKDKKEMYPILFTLLHSADLWYRYYTDILPALNEGKVVVCDRYYYTSHARDELRGVDRSLIDQIYKGIRKPDVIFHCYAPIGTVMGRIDSRSSKSYYGNGEDLKLSKSPTKNLKLYTEKLCNKYCEILPKEKGYVKLDMTNDIDTISEEIWDHVSDLL